MEERKKAVLIDGASLSAMRNRLGIKRIHYLGLSRILKQVGTLPFYGKPCIVLPETYRSQYWVKMLATYGYQVFFSPTENGKDDQVLIERMRSLDSQKVGEIIIVSTDQDYASILREKSDEGMRVYWVGTRKADKDGSLPIGTALEALFERGAFTFVELADHTSRLVRNPNEEEMDTLRRPLKVSITIPLTFKDTKRFVNKLLAVLGRFPGATYSIEST